MLDLGPGGTLPELQRHTDFRTLDAVVISHLHLDHVLDLLALRPALAYNPVSAPAPVPVRLPPGGADLLARAAAPFNACDDPGVFPSTVKIEEYDPSHPLAIGDAHITFAPTVHDVPGWAMRVSVPGATSLGYTGDTGPAVDLGRLFARVGALVAEATRLEPRVQPAAKRRSLTALEAGERARTAAADTLVLTHMREEVDFGAYRGQARSAFSGRLELARPGLKIAW